MQGHQLSFWHSDWVMARGSRSIVLTFNNTIYEYYYLFRLLTLFWFAMYQSYSPSTVDCNTLRRVVQFNFCRWHSPPVVISTS